jgi:ubiquinone/menaquinone biosynthesis C-methylase UbiE
MRSRLSPSRRRSSTKPDFGRVAGRYDALRPADENWWELFELLVREGDLAGRRVLDIGCGTGRAAAALAERGSRVWGVEPEPEMAALARERLSTVKVAPAEQLPFKDGWFDRALIWLVVHLVDRPRAFAEAQRVLAPDGRLAIATFHWDYFDHHWLGAFFPSLEQIDRAQFSKTEDLTAELEAAGFASVEHTRLSQPTAVGKESALARVRERYVSPLQLLDEDEYRAGLQRMEQDLPETVEYALEWLVAVANKAAN